SLLCSSLAPLPHLEGLIPHDLPDRDAERLSLCDRTDERAHCWARRSVAPILQRLGAGEAHVLLLQRQAELLAERAFHAFAGDPHRAREPDAGLDGDHQEVDKFRELVVDLLDATTGPSV